MVDSGHPLQWVIIEVIASFILGLLMKKKVARFFIRTWILFSNSITKINLISVRTYDSTEKIRFNMDIFHDMQKRLPNLKCDSLSDSAMEIGMPPFGTVIVLLSSESNLDDEDTSEEIKISLVIKDPIRLGIREMDMVHQYQNHVGLLFQVIERSFSKIPKIKNNYIIAELPRVGGFVEEKILEIDDKELSTHIHATMSKITISAEPPTYIAKAVAKYLFV